MAEDFDFPSLRAAMVETQLRARGIADAAVLRALGEVPRHEFLLPSDWDEAYADRPLPIGCGQTISQPYIVARMTELLRAAPGLRVLEIGTGSGYQTAVLAALGLQVFTVERHAPLADRARELLSRLGYSGINYKIGDGSKGWAREAPFDRIVVTAAAPAVPEALRKQLSPESGILVIPAGSATQSLRVVERRGASCVERKDIGVIFVKLIGAAGWSE